MKRSFLVWIAPIALLSGWLLGVFPASAASIDYTSWYRPDVLPTEADGTIENPIWKFQTSEGAISHLDEGSLFASTMGTDRKADRLQFWQIGVDEDLEYGSPSGAWDMSAESELTLDLSIRVNESESTDRVNSGVTGGFEVLVAFNGRGINLYFNTTGITVWAAKIIEDDLHSNTGFSTYRLVIQDGLASLFEAGRDEPLFADLEMRKGRKSYNVICFGTGTTTTAGAWDLAFLGWKKGLAEFSPPPDLNPSLLNP